ncbi:class I SAM-dependent methyltransferase [Saccharothrix syringae]|uniref:Class I SAM-dependent methyltransferase n=1 Tax=Saccharothrix syringae TaxID=103733 RepID=A0A5Q0GQU7_SACSY|nr:class I SAM-dependent methyltransferase [Saccharothrix syringae]QFZ16349.1 class I SAM-dependent methyltransferase [Saccharothrix syringae]
MTGDDLRARRANSFGAHAAAYAEHRPDYPATAVRWALAPLGPGRREVLDLAAGTGKLTGVLVAEGHHVTAVEPDEGMLAELVRRHGAVRALPGSAERIPLPDGSVDAVLVGQAFHWFDPPRALPEIARVLRPGGVLAALWNDDDLSVPWVAEFKEASGSSARARDLDLDWLPDHGLFADRAEETFRHSHRRTAESLVATLNTHSHLLVVPAEEREEVNARMLAFLRSRPETRGEFDLPLLTYVVRALRATA